MFYDVDKHKDFFTWKPQIFFTDFTKSNFVIKMAKTHSWPIHRYAFMLTWLIFTLHIFWGKIKQERKNNE
jgi:hypothetical protein